MTKQEFLDELERRLAKLPKEERKERVAFYEEMINDRMEEWPTEEQAVAMVGTVDEVIQQILVDLPLAEVEEQMATPRRKLKGWQLICLIVGSPIWASLLISVVAVLLAIYGAVWSVIIALWAIEIALGVGAIGTIASSILLIVQGNVVPGLAFMGIGFVCVGLTIFMFYACKAATKGIWSISRQMVLALKKRSRRKENAYD